MSSWRLAESLKTLRDEFNDEYPNRSTASDGTIGDAAHASRKSDHNPWIKDSNGIGVVRAMDITSNGIDVNAYTERIRQLGKAKDPRLVDGGYIISKRRIASERDNWEWRPYTGSNPHDKHAHLSVSESQRGYDDKRSWGIGKSAPSQPQEDWLAVATEDQVRKIVADEVNRAIAAIWADEASDKKDSDTSRKEYGSLRGWVAAIAEKVGATKADAMRLDPTRKD